MPSAQKCPSCGCEFGVAGGFRSMAASDLSQPSGVHSKRF